MSDSPSATLSPIEKDQETAPPMRGNTLQLVLGTGGFAICFAIFGSVSATMPILRKPEHLDLTPIQVSIGLAIPVLLGSLGRIPLGILTDRFGGRAIFIGVLIASIVPALAMGSVTTGNCWCVGSSSALPWPVSRWGLAS